MTPRQVAQAERQLEVMTWIDSLSGELLNTSYSAIQEKSKLPMPKG